MLKITKLFLRPERLTVLLITLLCPVLGYFVFNWDWLVETLRPDNYSYGHTFYSLLISILLTFNILLTLIFYRKGNVVEKITTCAKGTAMDLLLSLILGAMLYMIFSPLGF